MARNLKKESDNKASSGFRLKKSHVRLITILSIAASIFLVLYLSFYTNDQSLVPEKQSKELALYEDLLKNPIEEILNEYKISSTSRGISEEIKDLRKEAEQSFNNKEFKAAIPLFQKIIQEGNEMEYDHTCLGLSYLFLKDYPSAIQQFEWVINNTDPKYHQRITWPLALALVANGDYQEAKKYLSLMAEMDNNKRTRELAKKAKEILKAINK